MDTYGNLAIMSTATIGATFSANISLYAFIQLSSANDVFALEGKYGAVGVEAGGPLPPFFAGPFYGMEVGSNYGANSFDYISTTYYGGLQWPASIFSAHGEIGFTENQYTVNVFDWSKSFFNSLRIRN